MTVRFKIDIGDWSHDGHSQSDSFVAEADATDIYEVRQAYVKALELHPDFDPESYLNEYEENSIDRELYDRMAALGCPLVVEDYDEDDDPLGVWDVESMAATVAWFINLGAGREMCKIVEDAFPNLRGEIRKEDEDSRVGRRSDNYLNPAFGYGLYRS